MRTVTLVLACCVCLTVGCQPQERASPALPASEWAGLPQRLDQIQIIGTHNSYKLAIQPELMDLMRTVHRDAASLDYQHISITDQLNLGLRGLEIDVYWDPEGGRYADPLGHRLLQAAGIEPWPIDESDALAEPGFKVIHDADFDFRTHHVRLRDTLAELRAWSEENPGHIPITVTMNTKQGQTDVPGSVEPAAFDRDGLRRLDGVIG
ncbi:MAG: Ca2+-dependent phosphoinositide-specific phospholipase C, partial [Planctomycetota bacterium]